MLSASTVVTQACHVAGWGEAFLPILTTRSFLQHQRSTGEQLQKCRKCFSSLRLISHYKMPRQTLLPLWLPARHPELLQRSQQFRVFPIEYDHCKAPFFDRTPIPPLFSIQHLTFPSALISIYVTPWATDHKTSYIHHKNEIPLTAAISPHLPSSKKSSLSRCAHVLHKQNRKWCLFQLISIVMNSSPSDKEENEGGGGVLFLLLFSHWNRGV